MMSRNFQSSKNELKQKIFKCTSLQNFRFDRLDGRRNFRSLCKIIYVTKLVLIIPGRLGQTRVSARLKIEEQKIASNSSFDFLSHYYFLEETFQRVLSRRRKSRIFANTIFKFSQYSMVESPPCKNLGLINVQNVYLLVSMKETSHFPPCLSNEPHC